MVRCALWLAIAGISRLALAAPESPEVLEAPELFALGNRQAAQGDATAALVSYKRAYERLLPQIRGLSFIREVAPGIMSRADLGRRLSELMVRDLDDDELRLAQHTLTAFRLVDGAVDLRELMLELLTAEIAGFYDAKTKQMFLIDSSAAGGSFSGEESMAVLAHEMEHALVDQHFDLEALHDGAHGDDDMGLAIGAVVEGEAMLMMIIAADGDGSDVAAVIGRSPVQVAQLIGLLRRFLPFTSGDAFERAPKVIRESLLFPYLEGVVFALHLTNVDGWRGVDAALGDPPLSTEQILHPSRYWEPRDIPQRILLPALEAHLDGGWREVGRNVHGQLQAAIILGVDPRATAVVGWDGDAYAVFVDGVGHGEGYAWVSTWDSERDASEFAAAYTGWVFSSHPPAAPALARIAGRDGAWLAAGDRVSAIERVGVDVRIVEGLSLGATQRVMRALATCRREDKVLRRPQARP